MNAARLIRDAFTETFRKQGEQQRDKRLAEIALELEQVRVVLPGLAAQATIEIGVRARGIAEEAAPKDIEAT